MIFELLEFSPQLYFIIKKVNIAPIVADIRDTTKPNNKPNKSPPNNFRKGLIGMEKKTAITYITAYIKIDISRCSLTYKSALSYAICSSLKSKYL
ncbi:hypothetical protein fh0823_03360 [Francisella halioticida]|nr:hypothetical protein fh0823_03360 [Francisella halioticida]